MKSWLAFACSIVLGTFGLHNRVLEAAAPTIPACIIVDDPAPFINSRWTKDETVCAEIPTSFYVEFGRWAQENKIKGKFSVVPCLGGVKPIDGSLGEYPGHTREERLQWIEMVKTLYAPRFTVTPEVITHYYVWDIAAKKLLPGPQTENDWLAAQPLEVQTRYIAESMQMLKNVGLEIGGLTMCWGYPKAKSHILGEAALRAAEKVFGLKYIMIFNDTGDRPGVIYRREDGAMAVSLRPNVGDCYEHTFGKKTEEDIQRDAEKYITADGRGGQFVEAMQKHGCLIFYTHAQTLYGNGTKSGLKVFQIAIARLHKHYGERLEWMTGLDIARRFCPPDQAAEPKPGAAAPAAATDAKPQGQAWVGLFDTLRPLAEGDIRDGLPTRRGWQQVPEDKTVHRFQGDAVLCNRRIAVLLRVSGPGATVYSRAAEGWTRRAALVPCGAQPAKGLASIKALTIDGGTVAVEASFQAGGGPTLGLVCELGAATAFVRTEARGGTQRLRIQTEGRFGLVPDFYADDITFDAAKIPVAQAHIPTENMFAQALAVCPAMAVSLWDGPPQEIAIHLTGEGDGRTISAIDVRYTPRGKVYFALLDSPGACYADLFDRLPERRDPVAGFKLAAPVRRLDWQMPFPAQWRVDYLSEKDDPKWTRSREMSAPYPYPAKDGKCLEFRFIKPTYVWDWGGGTNTERTGNPDKYPSWVDFEGRGHVLPGGGSYAVVVYPFDRGRGTPLEAITLTDLVRQTLGVGPCQYILDADRRITQTPGIFTCGGTSLLKKLEGNMSQHKPEAEKLISDMLVFVKAYRARIEQYMAFKRDLVGWLADQQDKHPEQKVFIDKMKSPLGGISDELTQDFPKVIEELNVEYRATLGFDDEVHRGCSYNMM